jgi:hypothetical protein
MFEPLIELLYENIDDPAEAESVMEYHSRYIKDADEEDAFFKAIRDARLTGFKNGMKTMTELFNEIRRANT